MSTTQPSSAIPRRLNLLAVQGGPLLSAPLPSAPLLPAPPSCSFPKDKNYFYLKEVDWILFSAMQTVCPFPSQIKPDFTHDDPDIETIFQLQCNLSRNIQVAATPNDSELKYTGPLFQRLATIQIVGSGTSHTLCAGQKASWKWLEDTLHHTASIFSIDSLLPLEFSMLPLPSSYSYLHVHKKQSHAVQCAKKSRLAFHSLVGLVNLFYGRALVRYETGNYVDPRRPLSPSRTLIQSGLSETHVCDILDVLQLEVLGRCIGVVLDSQSSALGVLYPYLNCICVPVWVKIGTSKGIFYTNTIKHPAFYLTIPSTEEQLRIRAMINKTITQDFRPSPSDLDPNSLHQWNTLVEGWKMARELFTSRASDTVKERVKKRLQAALNFIIPTQRDGMRFFVWYHSKQGRFCGELNLEDAKKEFETRRRAEFAYDKISNQWDICSLFDKDRDLVDDDAQFNQSLQEDLAMPAPLLSNPPTLPSDHNKLGRVVVHQTTTGPDMLFSTYLEDILYSCCRLLCSTQGKIQSASDFVHIEDPQIVDTYTIRKYIMEANLPLEYHSNEFAIRYFISSLTLEVQPPSILWDLHPNHAQQLLTRNIYFKVKQVKDKSLPGYLVLPLDLKYARAWNLFLGSATSVIQCIREQWGPSLEDVILCLFECSIPFKLLFHVAYPSIPRPISVFESNRRPYGWMANEYKYADYELRRNRLLRLPHVRVAVAQAGGILWHLCKQELANEIPNGPSPDVLYFADTSPNSSHTYLYDTLSEHEIEILCGIYYVDTGMPFVYSDVSPHNLVHR
ncbi:hypothetical protein BDR04DRAFT_1163525 [Suillus decipiens]|nr:hypothetical protein BDR04DRAFT_1163525 [Suillus decipiens]